jgi:hypothetical protein
VADSLLSAVHPTPSEREAERSVTQPHLRRERHPPEPLSLASSVIVDAPTSLCISVRRCILKSEKLPPFKLVELVLPANQRVSANACFHCPQTPAPFPFAAQPARPNPTRTRCHCNVAAWPPLQPPVLVATFRHCRRCCISFGPEIS